MNQYTKTVFTTIPFIVAAWYFQKSHDNSIELGRRAESALRTAEVRLAGALASGTDPRRLVESCTGITGITCKSNGDMITVAFYSDSKKEEERVWRVNGHTLQFIGLAD